MFVYEKKLQYPVHIKNPNPKLAKAIITQYGGPNRSKRFVRVTRLCGCTNAGSKTCRTPCP